MTPPFRRPMKGSPFHTSPLPVIDSGSGWMVVEKPSGMSVHNAPGKDVCARLNQYVQSLSAAADAIAYDRAYGLNPVHRLDKETSGVMLLSCRREVFDQLARQFARGLVIKRYLALVHGSIEASDKWRLWQWPLTPKAAGRRNPKGKGRRSPCQTRYRLVLMRRHYSLIECRLGTGRTHQIRRHAVLAGHPVTGDKRYGSVRACRFLENNFNFTRLGLHAASLTIQPPDEHAPRCYASERLPAEIQRLLDSDLTD